MIDIIATIPLIVIAYLCAYLCGYYRGHSTAMSVPCARLTERMEEITQVAVGWKAKLSPTGSDTAKALERTQ